MEKRNFLLRKTYEEWLTNHLDSIDCYLMQNIDENSGFLYFDIIASFLYYDERTYAYSVLNKWFESIKNDKNKKSYWRKYKQFIQNIDIHKLKNECEGSPELIIPQDLESVRASFNKTDLAQIDGMDSLINHFSENEIITLAVESSYFFDKKIASKRHNEIIEIIKKNKTLPARKSQKNSETKEDNKEEGCQVENVDEDVYCNKDGDRICSIIIDGNGNAKVCQLINEYTGYNLAYKLENKPFVNFIISHIWGRAIDPRYFTNFWNIVLVPAWVNHLLDKNVDDEDSLASKLKATFMKICMKYYVLSKYSWKYFEDYSRPSCKGNYKKGKYKIQIIKSIDENIEGESLFGAEVGKIAVQDVQIK